MILFHSESNFILKNETQLKNWVKSSILKLKKEIGDINFIFCDDTYLLSINKKYLNHDTYTDIISFDYSENNILTGDIYISTERVDENAKKFNNTFNDELNRVIIHGILHFSGYNDKTPEEIIEMRKQEDYYLSLRNF